MIIMLMSVTDEMLYITISYNVVSQPQDVPR